MEKLDLSESEVKLALKQMKRKSQIPIISGSLKQFLNACEPRTDCRHHLRSSPTHNIRFFTTERNDHGNPYDGNGDKYPSNT
jgi:hypothetical protein